jgi:flagellar capping protein FliD
MQENAEYNANTKSTGPLYGKYALTSVSGQLQSLFTLVTDGFTSDDSFFMPSDIGLKIGSNDRLSLDASTFDDAIAEDYAAVLDLIGAIGKGSSNSETIKFYASGANTEPGTYNVKVVVADLGSGNEITSAKIWTSEETEADARDATIDGNTIIGDASFTDGYPDYPENSLTMTIDLTAEGTFEAEVYAGATKDLLDNILKTGDGRIDLAQEASSDYIDDINEKIVAEQRRLAKIEDALILKFARLEQTLSMLNQQMSGLNIG